MDYSKEINLEINRQYYIPIEIQQYDAGYPLKFKILNRGVAFNLSNLALRVKADKPDGTIIFNDLVLTDAAAGKCEFNITTQFTSVAGIVNVQLDLREGNKILNTIIFRVFVRPSINVDGLIESKDEFTALTSALKQVEDWDKYFEETSGKLEEKYTTRLNQIDSQLEEKESQIIELNDNKATRVELNELNNKTNSLASGSPKGTFATLFALQSDASANTTEGKKNIYVVTSDGNWYYWNGTIWTIGGIYQSIGMDKTLKDTTIDFLNIPTLSNKIINGDFSKGTNGWTPATAYNRDSILSVENNTLKVTGTNNYQVGVNSETNVFKINNKFYVKIKARVTNSDCKAIFFRCGADTDISIILNPLKDKWYDIENVIDIPQNINNSFIHIFHQYENDSVANGKVMELKYVVAINLTEDYGFGNEPKIKEISTTMEQFTNKYFNDVVSLVNIKKYTETPIMPNKLAFSEINPNKDWFINKDIIYSNTYINPETGIEQTHSSFITSDFIEVEENSPYIFDKNDFKFKDGNSINFYDYSKTRISGVYFNHDYFTTPLNCCYIRISAYLALDFQGWYLQKSKTINPVDNNPLFNNISVKSRLSNKKWTGVGDSITEKNRRAILNYHDFIVRDLGVNFTNMGVGGSGYKIREDENLAFYQRVLNVPTDSDIITIFGGVNDCLFNTSNIGTEVDINTDTWCGCVNRTIDNLESLMPYVPLGIITPLPCSWINPDNASLYPIQKPSDINCRMSLFVDKLIQICRLRGIPCLDLFHSSNLRPWVEQVNIQYFSCGDTLNGDGLHPNSHGHELIYRRIMEFIKILSK